MKAPAFAAAPAFALLAACATVAPGGLVYVGVAGDNDCIVEAAGEAFALPEQAAALAGRLRRLARRSDSALIGERPALTRPGCWDEAVALVRAAGFARIGYFAEDPPAGAEG